MLAQEPLTSWTRRARRIVGFTEGAGIYSRDFVSAAFLHFEAAIREADLAQRSGCCDFWGFFLFTRCMILQNPLNHCLLGLLFVPESHLVWPWPYKPGDLQTSLTAAKSAGIKKWNKSNTFTQMYANQNKTKNSQIRIYLLKFSVSQLKQAFMVIYTNVFVLNCSGPQAEPRHATPPTCVVWHFNLV